MLNVTQGDTGYGFELTLEDENGAVDLTDSTVLFLMGAFEIPAQIIGSGVVLVVLDAIHTANYGDYQALVRVTRPDGNVEHFPSKDYIQVRIKRGVS